MALAEIISSLQGFGIFDFFIPFVLAFAIFYGLLAKTQIFGKKEERFARTINLVISLAAAAYITLFVLLPNGFTMSTFLANMFGKTVVTVLSLMAFLIIFYLLMNVLMPGATWNKLKLGWLVVIIAIILGVVIFTSSGGTSVFGIHMPSISFGNIDSGTVALIVVIILIALVAWFLFKGEGGEDKDLGLGRK